MKKCSLYRKDLCHDCLGCDKPLDNEKTQEKAQNIIEERKMRKVEICKEGFYNNINNKPAEFCTGLFHGFYLVGSNDEGIECYGLIELPNGTLRMVRPEQMKFLGPN